jgi:hypothetical protein
MPAGMDGSTLTVTIGPVVGEIFGDLKSGSTSDPTQLGPLLIVGEATAPVVTSSYASAKQLEDYLLAQPGITPSLAAAIRALGDPSKTLPIPVPIQFATSTTVSVNGVSGLALGDNTGLGAAVIWIKNGVIYGVAGTVKQADLVTFANQLS